MGGTAVIERGEAIAGENSVIAGGSSNQALATHTTISGGQFNRAAVAYATVGGGRENNANFLYTTIAGGYGNLAAGRESTICGGSRNTANGDHSTIAGGIRNQANTMDTTIAGGGYNIADEVYASVGGGTRNIARGTAAAISGGAGNNAAGAHSSITGGLANIAEGNYSAILGGHQNIANGNYSLALGGFGNQASGDFSTAAGRTSQVAAGHQGTFLYADSLEFPFQSQSADEFAVRASGGVRFVSGINREGAPEVGVLLPAGSGSWEVFSSRSIKNDLKVVHGDQIYNGVMDLPIYTWTYRSEPEGAVHLGPTAEDFHAAFNLGNNLNTIATVDADGVALAALQEVGRRLQSSESAAAAQQARIVRIEHEIVELRAANLQLEQQRTLLISLIALVAIVGLLSSQSQSKRNEAKN